MALLMLLLTAAATNQIATTAIRDRMIMTTVFLFTE